MDKHMRRGPRLSELTPASRESYNGVHSTTRADRQLSRRVEKITGAWADAGNVALPDDPGGDGDEFHDEDDGYVYPDNYVSLLSYFVNAEELPATPNDLCNRFAHSVGPW